MCATVTNGKRVSENPPLCPAHSPPLSPPTPKSKAALRWQCGEGRGGGGGGGEGPALAVRAGGALAGETNPRCGVPGVRTDGIQVKDR
jgi:hypothetical protein